ncbi:MAG TPA: YggU family protein [Deltaproteobacteria bacterium]|nr:YggU family protein [Deltaproteobacteria bacterium]
MWIRGSNDSTIVECRIHPNSSRDSIDGIKEDRLCVRLSAPPIEGRANKALIRFFSKQLHLAKARITIIQGEKSRIKVLCLEGIGTEEVLSGLSITL